MKGKSNTPRRKRLTRKLRIAASSKWMKSYNGRNIISGYAKWFGVDKICAIIELKIVGYQISEDLEKQIRASIKAKRKKKKEVPVLGWESDENFAMIMGYTSGGAPYGITHEEYKLINFDEIYKDTIEEYKLFNFDEIVDYEDPIDEYELFNFDEIDGSEDTIEEYELFNFDEICEDNITNEFDNSTATRLLEWDEYGFLQ